MRSSPTGRFGDDKVFVVHVFRVLSNDPVFAAMGLDGFKQRLAEANNARRLDLSRGQHGRGHGPDFDVELSKVAYLGSCEFHFVCRMIRASSSMSATTAHRRQPESRRWIRSQRLALTPTPPTRASWRSARRSVRRSFMRSPIATTSGRMTRSTSATIPRGGPRPRSRRLLVNRAAQPSRAATGRILPARGRGRQRQDPPPRAFRNWVHAPGPGLCAYMQMTSATSHCRAALRPTGRQPDRLARR